MRVGQPDDHRRILTELRESIRRIERRPARRAGGVVCGRPEIDAAVPDGFPRGAISELAGGAASGKTAVALAVLAALGPEELYAWVDGRGELYPPAAAARGVDLARLLIVRPGALHARPSTQAASRPTSRASGSEDASTKAALWAAEALLGSSAFAAVVVDVPLRSFDSACPERSDPSMMDGSRRRRTQDVRGWDAMARRLQAAAEKGGAVGLWLSSPRAPVRVPAALRIELTAEGDRVMARRMVGGIGRVA